ncbi:MAG: hypothetical protein Q8S35_03485 [bacterium]|nr:hypothetical protein [bacterium]
MEKKHKIGNVTAGFMILLALLVDGLQFILTLVVVLIPFSLLATFIAGIGFALWFFLLGVYSGKGAEKKVLTSAVSVIAEFIPVINAIPAITAGVVLNIVLSRLDDAHISLAKPDPRKVLAATRKARMDASRARLREKGSMERQQTQNNRHAPANNNEGEGEMREAA